MHMYLKISHYPDAKKGNETLPFLKNYLFRN